MICFLTLCILLLIPSIEWFVWVDDSGVISPGEAKYMKTQSCAPLHSRNTHSNWCIISTWQRFIARAPLPKASIYQTGVILHFGLNSSHLWSFHIHFTVCAPVYVHVTPDSSIRWLHAQVHPIAAANEAEHWYHTGQRGIQTGLARTSSLPASLTPLTGVLWERYTARTRLLQHSPLLHQSLLSSRNSRPIRRVQAPLTRPVWKLT